MGATGRDELAFEQTWQLLDVRTGRPVDVTILAPAPATGAPALPRMSVHDPAGPAAPDPASDPGPDLVVLDLLGEGGMGRVELARQRSLDREVALKRPRATSHARDAQSLRAEALITGYLEHPNIVPIHALGRDDAGQPVIVMKRVEGVSWRELLHDDEHPGWASREPSTGARLVWHLQILAQMCNAIAFAHSRGIVHRDMKPDNVMIGEFGEVYLIDWGAAARAGDLARAGGRPILVGTPVYMAPEMVTGGQLDPRTDVYLLGATLHEILTRRVRHQGADLHAVLLSAFSSQPVEYGDGVPPDLAELANRATDRDPDRRPPSALAFRQALVEHIRHRASLGLSADAEHRLVEVEGAVAGGRLDGPIDGWVEECRFGFRQALREWPENPDAAVGLDRCATAVVQLEIRRGNAVAARTALSALANPPEELRAALARLEGELLADRAERTELRKLARDLDPRAGGRSRSVILAVLFVVAIGIAVYSIVFQYGGGGLSDVEQIAFPAVMLVAAGAAMVAVRRRLLVSAINRRLAAFLLTAIAVVLLSRIVGAATRITLERQYLTDQVLLCGLIASCAVFTFRWIWICAAVLGAGAVLGIVAPELAIVTFAVCISAVIVISAFLLPSELP